MSAMAGAGGAAREQALSLLAAANNHGDLTVKLSSLKQVRDILLSVEHSLAGELFPYLVELQSSPECLVRKSLIEVMEETGLKVMEHAYILIPVLMTFLEDRDSIVAKQSIVSGTIFFCRVLEEMAVQFHRRGRVEKWIEELWTWMVKFKDAVFGIALEHGSVGTKLLAMKFLETYVFLFSSDSTNSEKSFTEGNGSAFNVSWLVDGHPVLDPVVLMSEANRTVGILLKLLQSASSLPGPLTIIVVNCLAAIARRRPLYYGTILTALLDFDPNFDMLKGGHAASVQYSLRTAFLGFLRCKYPAILESRDRLLRALREMNAGDAADQVIRQVDKLIKNTERASRDARLSKDEQLLGQLPFSGDTLRKRSMLQDIEEATNPHELAPKRTRYDHSTHSASTILKGDYGQDNVSVNGVSLKVPMLESNLTPVEQMIAMIGALVGEGERGAESLELLISTIHPDLLADIVITNMKHLPKTPPPLTRLGNLPGSRQPGPSSSPEQIVAPTTSSNYPVLSAQMPSTSATVTCSSLSDTSNATNLPVDSKRDPRRDPRRLDPRRMADAIIVPSVHMAEDTSVAQSDSDGSISLNKPLSLPGVASSENASVSLIVNTNSKDKILEIPLVSPTDLLPPIEEVVVEVKDTAPIPAVDTTSDLALSPVRENDEGCVESMSTDIYVTDEVDIPFPLEFDQNSPDISSTSTSDESSHELPLLPSYIDMTEEQQVYVRKSTVERIIESYKNLGETDSCETRMALLARLVAQTEADDDVVILLQKHIVSDYQSQKGHELVLHVLYHLHTVMISDSVEYSSSAAVTYEKLLIAVAKSLLEKLPASDKAFSRLLGEVPLLPDSALKLLEDLCYSDVIDGHGKVLRESDRVTQGLGAVWSLILGRPLNRQACLNIALKSAVHAQDEIRAKAIRLVANKLYLLSYISGNIEQFATNMLLSAVDQRIPDMELSQSGPYYEPKTGEVGSQETSTSGSQNSEPGISETESIKDAQSVVHSVSTKSFPEAQCFISLFFALCTKKPSLLQLVFSIYGRAPKAVKQAVHRHIPVLIRALGTSNSELLHIISDPPQGSENLLSLVLQILTEETTPSSDLIATVKYLYETKLKDASILIPMLSSLSKKEVLPIFPRLVDLPLEKFQKALAHILQGSAHTGPALTPAEVLVAIHDISPEKDGIPLKKITDACSACFEQRMVFTQQVLAKALNEMVDQDHLPLLFMRTVIQAIDAFPKLVNCVMEILSKLVNKQVWKMPKLWVGFLKCISQTQPHSFHVLLQLPPPQLESALNKHARLRAPLAAYASQPSIRPSLPRSTLVILGLVNESHIQQPHLTSLHPSDTSSSVHGATLT